MKWDGGVRNVPGKGTFGRYAWVWEQERLPLGHQDCWKITNHLLSHWLTWGSASKHFLFPMIVKDYPGGPAALHTYINSLLFWSSLFLICLCFCVQWRRRISGSLKLCDFFTFRKRWGELWCSISFYYYHEDHWFVWLVVILLKKTRNLSFLGSFFPSHR